MTDTSLKKTNPSLATKQFRLGKSRLKIENKKNPLQNKNPMQAFSLYF